MVVLGYVSLGVFWLVLGGCIFTICREAIQARRS